MTHADYCSKFVPHGGNVLDIGSGRGRFLCDMSSKGFKAFGVETNPSYIIESKKNAAEKNLEIFVSEGQAEKLPFADGSFDFINSAEVTEHVESPKKVCEEIFRVLKPGGKCYISFSNRWCAYDYHYHIYFINWMPKSWTEPVLQFLGKQKEDGPAGRQKLTTMHYYTYNQAIKILADAGFLIKDIRANKIRKKFGPAAIFILPAYYLFLRPLYFNTFHLLIEKRT